MDSKKKHKRIRRVSMDKFYEIVTGQEDAFYQMCMQLPKTIEKVVAETAANVVPHDSVLEELNEMSKGKKSSFVLHCIC